jgi:hypothetical protein
MHSFKNIVASLAIFGSLTSAAFLKACTRQVLDFAVQDLRDFRSLLNAGVYPPVKLCSQLGGFSNDCNFSCDTKMDFLNLCLDNQFISVGTTIFPQEMTELLDEYIGCHERITANPQAQSGVTEGTVFGDNKLSVNAQLQFGFSSRR